jgi:hypothetical protein
MIKEILFPVDFSPACAAMAGYVGRAAQQEIVPTNIRPTRAELSFMLSFVGGYGDAAGFVLARMSTGHVTRDLVLEAIAVASRD